MARIPNVAVLLAGCGHVDGAEIREAVFTLLALDQHGARVQCIAPNDLQHHVIEHVKGHPVPGASRNMLEEASRIARLGGCLDLAAADPAAYDALLLPGGFGVAKNLCTFAFQGPEGSVREDVARFLSAFFEAGRPVGAICISPALVAMVLARSGRKARLTLGQDPGVAEAMRRLGAEPQSTASAREVVVDPAHRLVTTGAYMFDEPRLTDVWIGIERCVAEVLRMVPAE